MNISCQLFYIFYQLTYKLQSSDQQWNSAGENINNETNPSLDNRDQQSLTQVLQRISLNYNTTTTGSVGNLGGRICDHGNHWSLIGWKELQFQT